MPAIGGLRDRADVLRIIERRIVENTERLRECRERSEHLNVEYLRGCISELEVVRRVVEAMPSPPPLEAGKPGSMRASKRHSSRVLKAARSGNEAPVCEECARAAGGRMPPGHVCGWWIERCVDCGREREVTAMRDWVWPRVPHKQ